MLAAARARAGRALAREVRGHGEAHALVQAQALHGLAAAQLKVNALDVHALWLCQLPAGGASCSLSEKLYYKMSLSLRRRGARLTRQRTCGWTHRSKKASGATTTSKMSAPTRRSSPPRGT